MTDLEWAWTQAQTDNIVTNITTFETNVSRQIIL